MVSIRVCTAADVVVLAALEPAGRDFARQAHQNQVEGRSTFLVAWDQTVPVGSCEVAAGDHPEIRNLNVAPGQRRRGIGTALIAAAEAGVATAGEMSIGVSTDNLEARRLYLRLGYVPTGRRQTITYDYVDDAGVRREATETDEALTKTW